nr:hypothetical protein [Oceanococcus sp. HetDA_MAG_MS8]
MSTLNNTLKSWTELAQKANEPLLGLLKSYEELGQSLSTEHSKQLETALAEAKASGETLLGAKTIGDAVTAQRNILNAWTELLQQQAQSWAQSATDATESLTQTHEEAGREALELLGQATDQLSKDAVGAVEQYLTNIEVALSWMLKLAAQPKTA